MKIIITRLYENPIIGTKKQTIGDAVVVDDSDISIYNFNTLELPYLDNMKEKSSIPTGEYKCVKRVSEKYGWHWHVLDVENRSLILIHNGNYYSQSRGCVLVGSGLKDINGDGLEDVINSNQTMIDLRRILPDEFLLEIKWRE
jgi:hypothetical protein